MAYNSIAALVLREEDVEKLYKAVASSQDAVRRLEEAKVHKKDGIACLEWDWSSWEDFKDCVIELKSAFENLNCKFIRIGESCTGDIEEYDFGNYDPYVHDSITPKVQINLSEFVNEEQYFLFNVNNERKLTLSQEKPDAPVLVDTNEYPSYNIPAGDMVMLLNYYRFVKDHNVQCDFINPHGTVLEDSYQICSYKEDYLKRSQKK